MNYSEMTDFEINCAVAKLDESISKILVPYQENDNPSIQCIKLGGWYWFNPCNSWADAGPIIEKHLICLAADVFAEPQDGGKWVARPAYGWDSERVRSKNPLRAAMIVFLMMKESEK